MLLVGFSALNRVRTYKLGQVQSQNYRNKKTRTLLYLLLYTAKNSSAGTNLVTYVFLTVRQQPPVSRTQLPTSTTQIFCLAKETAAVSFPVMSVDVYGTSHTNLAEVKRHLDELISDECISKDVQSRHIADLLETDKKAIVSLSRTNQVSVLVTSLDKLTVSGKKDDVLDAVLKINGFIQAARDREMRAGEVKRLRETLCWERARGDLWEPLDPAVSYDIELAYHTKQKSFQYQENGESYTVDFSEKKLTNSKQESCRIKRTLLGDSDTGTS